MKLVSREDVEKARKVWKDWKDWRHTTGEYDAAHAYYLYLKTRRRYETGE